MWRTKYVKSKDNDIIVFGEHIQHTRFKYLEPVSAGFIKFQTNTSTGAVQCECYGESIGLDLKCQEEDSKIAQMQILGDI